MAEHHRDDQIVVGRAVRFRREGEATGAVVLGQGNGDHAGQNHQERKQHFRNGGDERRAARRGHGFRRHGPLHHEEIGAPITERKHETETHEHAEPFDAHRIVRGAAHEFPGIGKGAGRVTLRGRDTRETGLQSAPATNVAQPEKNQRRKSGDDEEELHDFVVDRRGEAAERDVKQHDDGGEPDAKIEIPAKEQIQAAAPSHTSRCRRRKPS